MPTPDPSSHTPTIHDQRAAAIAFLYAFGGVFTLYGMGIYLGMPDILHLLLHPITSVSIAHDNGFRLSALGVVTAAIGGINHLLYNQFHQSR